MRPARGDDKKGMQSSIQEANGGALTRDDFAPSAGERRRDERARLFRPIRVFSLQRGERLGHLADCSPHGVAVLLRLALHEGERFLLKLRLDRMRMVVYRVCYSRPQGDGWYRMGGLLEDVAEAEGHELEAVFQALLHAAAGDTGSVSARQSGNAPFPPST